MKKEGVQKKNQFIKIPLIHNDKLSNLAAQIQHNHHKLS